MLRLILLFWEITFLRNPIWTLRPRLLASYSVLHTTYPLLFASRKHKNFNVGPKIQNKSVAGRELLPKRLLLWTEKNELVEPSFIVHRPKHLYRGQPIYANVARKIFQFLGTRNRIHFELLWHLDILGHKFNESRYWLVNFGKKLNLLWVS